DKTAASAGDDQSRLPVVERELEAALRIVQLRDAEIARLADAARSTSDPATVERVGVVEQQLKAAIERAEASEAASVELEQNLNNEIEARIAENAWLRRNYEVRLETQADKLAEVEKALSEISAQRD